MSFNYVKPPESSASSTFLELPKPYKQFLISPPSSPPVGWEAHLEKEPTINYDLISAITNLAPGLQLVNLISNLVTYSHIIFCLLDYRGALVSLALLAIA